MTLSPNITSSPSKKGDRLLALILRSVTTITAVIVVLILTFLVIESFSAIREIGFLPFFMDSTWHPTEGTYNLVPILLGTFFAAIGAVLLATPLGVASAIFCEYYAPKFLRAIYQKAIEILAGIPSVVYGLWGLVVLVPFIASVKPPGVSLLAGIIVLAIMILPIVSLVTQSAIRQIPIPFVQGATALGLRRWSTIRHIVLPAAWPGIFTGVILQTARAIGETMAIVMVCGNVVQIPSNLFEPIRTLTANIALEMAYATGGHRAALFFTGLVLLLIVIGLLSITNRISPAHANR